MAERPVVILDPAFRRIDEIFDEPTRSELGDRFEVVWGRDEPMPTAEFLARLPDAMAVVVADWRHGAVDLSGGRLRALLEVAGGHRWPGVDVDRLVGDGILVGSCAPAFGPAVAELTLALALNGVRGIGVADRRMRARNEEWLHEGNVMNTTLLGANVGFIGCGGIARRLRTLLRPFDVNVLGYDPPLAPEAFAAMDVQPAGLEQIFDSCSVVFVLAAPTPDNRHLVDASLMDRLTPTQLLVLVSRAHLVDFDALTELTGAGRFKVATDVFPTEPLPHDHPLRDVDSATLSPHLAGALPSALHAIGRGLLADLVSIAAGETPTEFQYLTEQNMAWLVQALDADRW